MAEWLKMVKLKIDIYEVVYEGCFLKDNQQENKKKFTKLNHSQH